MERSPLHITAQENYNFKKHLDTYTEGANPVIFRSVA